MLVYENKKLITAKGETYLSVAKRVQSDYDAPIILAKLGQRIVELNKEIPDEIISKVPLYAVERTEAFTGYGFTKSDRLMVGTNDHYAYKDYWTISK